MYQASAKRYDGMTYKRCGRSGLLLPAVSLGLWHNFGDVTTFDNARNMLLTAFDAGITHFDLANNYGPAAGSAETTFGRVLAGDLRAYRDEMIISTKAGYFMWDGPYGDHGSRKYLMASLDQSLRRMGLDYVDIFYHHRPDADTPIEETMGALADIVRSGKALYVGLSNYSAEQTRQAVGVLAQMGVHCLIHQCRYNMFDRWVENGLYDVLAQEGIGAICFSPLAQGLLTDRYLNGISEDSRAAGGSPFLREASVTPDKVEKARRLNQIAQARGQTLAQLSLCWLHRKDVTASVIIGASKPAQITDCVRAVEKLALTQGEIDQIEAILAQ